MIPIENDVFRIRSLFTGSVKIIRYSVNRIKNKFKCILTFSHDFEHNNISNLLLCSFTVNYYYLLLIIT